MKSVQIRCFSGPYFLVFGLNIEIYSVNLRIQSEYRKIRTRKNSIFGHFSHSDSVNFFRTSMCLYEALLSLFFLVAPANIIYLQSRFPCGRGGAKLPISLSSANIMLGS